MHAGGGRADQEEEGACLGEDHAPASHRSSEEDEDSDAASSYDEQSGSDHGSPTYRVKQTARKSTGRFHPPRQLATKRVAQSADYESAATASAEDDYLGEDSAEDDDKEASEEGSSDSGSGREYRVKQTARKSTGRFHPPRQLATAGGGKLVHAVDLTSEDEPPAKSARTHEVVRNSEDGCIVTSVVTAADSSATARANAIDLTDEPGSSGNL